MTGINAALKTVAHVSLPVLAINFAVAICPPSARAMTHGALASSVDAYLEPYVASNNFSGVVLIADHGKLAYQKAFGFSDISAARRNTTLTRFHLASMSMQLTAAAAMRLVELKKLRLDQPISDFVSGLPYGERITVRNLLEENSGLPDVNALPEYAAILGQHQTAKSLVDYIKNKDSRFEPGGNSRGEEHSAFNVLALIVEQITHLSFAEAVKELVLTPLSMTGSGIDEDRALSNAATGYAPVGVRGLEPAQRIHWSAKTGNASAYATAADLLKWTNAFFGDRLLDRESRQIMLDYSQSHVGYGWFKSISKRFGVPVFSMNGRAPGFASFLMQVPSEQLTVVVLSNVYVSSVSDVGADLVALMMGKPYVSVLLKGAALSTAETAGIANQYRFGADFYQPNATLSLKMDALDASLHWPSGDITYLIPISKDHFIDRSYWEPIEIQRSGDGRVDSLMYDRFLGKRVEE